jgi:hypothetical protein
VQFFRDLYAAALSDDIGLLHKATGIGVEDQAQLTMPLALGRERLYQLTRKLIDLSKSGS